MNRRGHSVILKLNVNDQEDHGLRPTEELTCQHYKTQKQGRKRSPGGHPNVMVPASAGLPMASVRLPRNPCAQQAMWQQLTVYYGENGGSPPAHLLPPT